MYSSKPLVPTNLTPAEAIGHDYEAFCRLYRKYYLARAAATADNKNYAVSFTDETESLIFTSALRKLEQHGYVPQGLDEQQRPRFMVKLQNSTDERFNDDKTYGGVPPLSVLENMPLEEVKRLGRSAFKDIG